MAGVDPVEAIRCFHSCKVNVVPLAQGAYWDHRHKGAAVVALAVVAAYVVVVVVVAEPVAYDVVELAAVAEMTVPAAVAAVAVAAVAVVGGVKDRPSVEERLSRGHQDHH